MAQHTTRFGSLRHYEKGGVEVINDDIETVTLARRFDVVRAFNVAQGYGPSPRRGRRGARTIRVAG